MIVRAIAARLAVVALVSGCASSPPPAQNAYANATVTSTPSPPVTSSAPVTRNGMRALPLSAVATSFATYLNAMHARIHPEFTDKELAKLAALPANDPLNDKTLRTKLELVVGGADGRLVSVTVAKSSGAPGFDAAAVDSVRRADGFGVPPRGIVSEDGNVYVDWEFSRDETFACSTMHSRPFLLAR